jgi:hypothetical protein
MNARRRAVQTTSGLISEASTDDFWGHVGVLLPSAPHSQWYPITDAEKSRTEKLVAAADHDKPWLTVTTLANRLLLINLPNVNRIWFLKDGAGAPEGDWKAVGETHGLEFFQALRAHLIDSQETASPSRRRRSEAEAFVANYRADEHGGDTVEDFLFAAKLYLCDGHRITWVSHWQGVFGLVAVAQHARALPAMVPLADQDQNWSSFVPAKRLVLIDIPITELLRAETMMTGR